ncbi:MAG: carbohydrate ABC transporter permease [Treponema sp.]|jgi:multiple sugar transport system permease protein|nr:carbohydrate ABC transporter permease [Treponema sp.]
MKEQKMRKKAAVKFRAFDLCAALILTGAGVVFLLPFIWMVIVSFERYANIQPPFPPRFTLETPSLFNYRIAVENGRLLRAYGNSFFVALLSVSFCLASSLLGGYALSKGIFRGKKAVMLLILSTMMIPFETRMIPMFLMFNRARLANTFWPLILPSVLDAFNLLLAKNYFDTLPDSLAESAEIDGAGRFRVFLRIFVPLTGPIAATIIILKFLGSWNAFLWPLVVLTGERMRTIPLYMAIFADDSNRFYGTTLAVAVLGVLPVLAVFLLMQKYIIRSVALSGLKGE